MGDTEAEPRNTTDMIVPKNTVDSNRPLNPIFSIVSNFLQLFKFPPPPKKQGPQNSSTDDAAPTKEVGGEESKPDFVRFPRQSLPAEVVKLEDEEYERNTNTNPVVLWQVYAIGGFFILKWAWARWAERRKDRRRSSDDESSPADD